MYKSYTINIIVKCQYYYEIIANGIWFARDIVLFKSHSYNLHVYKEERCICLYIRVYFRKFLKVFLNECIRKSIKKRMK